MKLLLINDYETRKLLPMTDCLEEVVDNTFRSLADNQALNPLRHGMWQPERQGVLGMMPAYLASQGIMGIKVISVFPGNEGTPFESHQGAVILFETERGRPLAIVDASAITAIRTAAASGVATRALARPKASRLTILGSGVQVASHLVAMLLVRPLSQVRVWSRNPESARAFAVRKSDHHQIVVEPVYSAAEAVVGADIICTTTAASQPVLKGDWLEAGSHINAVGSSVPSARELDGSAVARAQLFIDRREATLNEAGDFLLAREEGMVTDDHIQAELGQVLTGRHPGRQTVREITLFKSLGQAVQDVAAAYHVYQHALARKSGTWIYW